MTTFHGQLYLRDEVPPRSKYHDSGRFGRLFPTLPPFARDTEKVRQALLELGKPGGIMDPGPGEDANPNNPEITAGFTFLGQFLDHDLTFDPTSSLERQNDPEAITNFRTPAFELDTVYGSGRGASPHLYDRAQPGKLLIDADFQRDLPRNSQNGALTGDPRNDENVIISQLHLAFIKFHNAVFDKVMAEGIADRNLAFEEAQRLVRWHYQWIVLYQFLPLTVGEDLVKDILKNGRKIYNWQNEPFIPVEFSVAAYRFGHSQIRPFYQVNGGFGARIFDNTLNPDEPDPQDLRGGKRADRRFVEWDRFFQLSGTPPQPSKLIDTKLSPPLFTLPLSTIASNMPGNPISLAQRNLLRALVFSLPSGQRVACALKIRPLTVDALASLNLDKSTPLWFYILHESSLEPVEGKMLGPVGGRIVAEVFIGLLEGDSMSFLRQDPDWTPTLPSEKKGDFRITDLLKFAGVA
jgi:hypothetical protein